MDQTGDQVLSPALSARDLAIDDLSFSYDGQTPVFKNVSFTIPHGKTTAIAGESGIGKTTLCHLFMRLYTPDAGTITWGGQEIHRLDRKWFRTPDGHGLPGNFFVSYLHSGKYPVF